MRKNNLSSKDGFEAAAELLWRSEIITSACTSCKGKRTCYSSFLTLKTQIKTEKEINKIRVCKIRLSNLGF